VETKMFFPTLTKFPASKEKIP